MSTNHINSGCIEVYLNPETKEPESCLIRVNSSVLLTPSLLSTQALIVILQRILEGIENHKSRQDILADSKINEVLRRVKQEDSFFNRLYKFFQLYLCIHLSFKSLSNKPNDIWQIFHRI